MNTNRAMVNKFAVGGQSAQRMKTRQPNTAKHSVYVPELKMTLMVEDGADIGAIVQKYQSQRDWERQKMRGRGW